MNALLSPLLETNRRINHQLVPKGSYAKRMLLAEQCNADFFEKIKPYINDNGIDFKTYKRILNSYFKPLGLKLKIRPVAEYKDYSACVIYENNAYELQVPIDTFDKKSKQKIISRKNIPICMHENFHMFSDRFSLKQLCRMKMVKDTNYNLFFNAYHHHDGITSKNKKDILAKINSMEKIFTINYSAEDKINLFQYYRYRLDNEVQAYNESKKYSKKLGVEYKHDTENYHFGIKIDILKNKIAKLIKTIRGKC